MVYVDHRVFFSIRPRPPPRSTLFPYTTLFRSANDGEKVTVSLQDQKVSTIAVDGRWMVRLEPLRAGGPFTMTDRKSTRLNSSHVSISYAVFCLKNKKDCSHYRPRRLHRQCRGS